MNFSFGQCNPTSDSLALVALYQNTNGSSWTTSTNWLVSGMPISTWYGITTNADGCVTCIDLDGFADCGPTSGTSINLSGQLPVELANLSKLQSLILSGNQLSGEIPSNLGMLSDLENLVLFDNQLEGGIPSELGDLSKLTVLSLSFNQLIGEIPTSLEDLADLQILALNRNQLIGSIPIEITNLTNLTQLQLWDNLLTGEIPSNIGNMSSLTILRLEQNQLTGEIPIGIGSLNNLEFLLLSNNELTGIIPNDLAMLNNLRWLVLWDNHLTGEIPSSLENLSALELLSLSTNELTGEIPSSLGNLSNLEFLALNANQLSGTIPIGLGDLSSLEELHLWGNILTGEIPIEIGTLTNLQRLTLSFNQFTGNIAPVIQTLPNLEYLTFHQNNLTFEDLIPVLTTLPTTVAVVGFPQNLFFTDTTYYAPKGSTIEINLDIDNSVTDNAYEWIKNSSPWNPDPINSPNSNTLTLPNIELSDVGIYKSTATNPTFSAILNSTLESYNINVKVCDVESDSLQLVNLFNSTDGNNWTNTTNWIQPGISIGNWYGITTDDFGCVSTINLNNNSLAGILPSLNLNTLDTLILSNNNLTGIIPTDLMFPFLKHIDLSGNMLTGEIPAVVSDWFDLQGLNLSNNQLTGIIPPDIGDLCELEELRLNDNLFTGELPVELTKLTNLQIGRVDFSSNTEIDSLQQKIAFFCPFGEMILNGTSSSNRFQNICNILCDDYEWDNLIDAPWVTDTLDNLTCIDTSCEYSFAQSGFVTVRNIKVMFTRTVCFTDLSQEEYTEEVLFYDCGGNLLETAICEIDSSSNSCNIDFGSISLQEFDSLNYDIRWTCGENSSFTSSVDHPFSGDLIPQNKIQPISVFPNPTSSKASFDLNPDMDLDLIKCTNIWGQLVDFTLIKNQEVITIEFHSPIPSLYYISIPGTWQHYMGKVILHP